MSLLQIIKNKFTSNLANNILKTFIYFSYTLLNQNIEK